MAASKLPEVAASVIAVWSRVHMIVCVHVKDGACLYKHTQKLCTLPYKCSQSILQWCSEVCAVNDP